MKIKQMYERPSAEEFEVAVDSFMVAGSGQSQTENMELESVYDSNFWGNIY